MKALFCHYNIAVLYLFQKDPTTIPLGKRSVLEVREIEKREDISASSLLNILNSPEGQAIIKVSLNCKLHDTCNCN